MYYSVCIQVLLSLNDQETKTFCKTFENEKHLIVAKNSASDFLYNLSVEVQQSFRSNDFSFLTKFFDVEPFTIVNFALAMFLHTKDNEEVMIFGNPTFENQLSNLSQELEYYQQNKWITGIPEVFITNYNQKIERKYIIKGSKLHDYRNLDYKVIHLPFVNDLNDEKNWRNDTDIKSNFIYEDYPDDLPVIVYDENYKTSKTQLENIWVRTIGVYEDYYLGRIMNKPTQLVTLKENEIIIFKIKNGTQTPTMVTDNYLIERENWKITPCDKCGFTELFDSPSELFKIMFERNESDDEIVSFSTFCNLCGGVQIIESISFKE